jgi:hypothetical protein
LASQGHDLYRLIDGYPALMVKGLLSASQVRRRHLLAEQAVALTVAVTGALDLAFNQGKGKVMERWLKEMSGEEKSELPKEKPKMSDRAFSFFTGMPRQGPDRPAREK